MRSLYSVALAALALALAGCLSDAKDPDAPPPGTGDGVPDLPIASATFRAQFDPGKAIMPYPNDILGFLAQGSPDGTLNLPAQALQLAAPAVNQLDGFSIFSRMQANFTGAVAPASLNPGSVFLIEVALDAATRAVIGLSDGTICKITVALIETCTAMGLPTVLDSQGNPFLVQGTDYELSVAPDVDSGGQTIQLVPLKPLNPFTFQQLPPAANQGAINGYLMIITNRVTRTDGQPAAPDTTYAQIRAAYQAGLIPLPPPPGLPADQLLGVFVATHLAVVDALSAAGAPLAVSNVVATASFSTQDTTAVMQAAADLEFLADRPSQVTQALLPFDFPLPGGGVLPAGSPVTTGLVRSLFGLPAEANRNNGNAYVGGINLPYFQQLPDPEVDGRNVLTSTWVAEAGGNVLGNPTSTVLSRWNPIPVKRADVTVPLIVVTPNENSATWQAREAFGLPNPPPEGWPVVIHQHGVTQNRTEIFLVAEPFLDNGFAVVTIDLPLHGIGATDPAVDPTALFRVPGTTERHFDLDLRNNANPGALTPDGIIDTGDAAFANMVNPAPPGPLAARDNFRESVVSVLALRRSLAGMDLDGDPETTDLDASRVAFSGHSIGAILGALLLAVSDEFSAAVLPNGGAGWAGMLEESARFGAFYQALRAGLQQAGIVPDGSVFNNYVRDFQHILNEADPIGYGREAARGPVPILFMMVNGDTTVPNSANLRFANVLGLPQIATPGANFTSRGYTRLTEGGHSSYLAPVPSVDAWIEMATQASVFVGGFAPQNIPGDGQVILISNPNVVETDAAP
jgi:hypothetical protein